MGVRGTKIACMHYCLQLFQVWLKAGPPDGAPTRITSPAGANVAIGQIPLWREASVRAGFPLSVGGGMLAVFLAHHVRTL